MHIYRKIWIWPHFVSLSLCSLELGNENNSICRSDERTKYPSFEFWLSSIGERSDFTEGIIQKAVSCVKLGLLLPTTVTNCLGFHPRTFSSISIEALMEGERGSGRRCTTADSSHHHRHSR
ncbi:hypothetical protein L1987_17470 [Smallanthus sonchifolius]|uniref:Uncharacterized protein n=4 Tax=Smallanthus sonchifolius TaxID=185202 RepID=A0ACB9EDK0_9ASTR|nr:hypothetical protein L1987_84653 [Smallanthus sonchifolius]KAI3754995.1 hypothetical protein L1987_54787 [Smallanthus sonchifolius]KAI3756537.1 hypothetical protein L1987_56358 [Smallanthus sonchifolius]KAI3812758.1 hypothetical protein L1987_17470 [Smallanthus sonchifolius]